MNSIGFAMQQASARIERLARVRALFLEKILKGHAGIVRSGGSRLCLFLHSYSRRIIRASVSRIFLCDPLQNGLGTLKPARRFEIRALFAAMELKAALRAFSQRIEIRRQYHSAAAATRDGVRPGQIWSFRPEALGLRTLRRAGPLLTSVAARILVTSLSIFSVITHGNFPPTGLVRADYMPILHALA